jgi:uncharacterized membrane protein YhfC
MKINLLIITCLSTVLLAGCSTQQASTASAVPASITPLALIQGTGMVLVALGFILFALVRRLGIGYLALGALAWVITVASKFAIAIQLNPIVLSRLAESGLPVFVSGPLSWIYIGILTGITEILITYLVLKYTRLGKVNWERALSFGIGFGAVEALLLGIGPLLSVIAALFFPTSLPVEALNSLALLNNPLYGLAGVWERFFTILIHIFSNALIFYAVLRREPKWFWLAFVYKSSLDAVAGYAQLSGDLTALGFIWTIEAIVAVMGILGLVGTRWIGKRYRQAWEASHPQKELGAATSSAQAEP